MTDSTTYIWATMCEPLTVRKDTTELKSCPFCGCQDIETIDYSINIEGVLCLGCGVFVIAKDGTKDGAIELWNRRVKE